jgi:hypothetical protein
VAKIRRRRLLVDAASRLRFAHEGADASRDCVDDQCTYSASPNDCRLACCGPNPQLVRLREYGGLAEKQVLRWAQSYCIWAF